MIESIIFRTDAKTLSTMVCVSICGIMANEQIYMQFFIENWFDLDGSYPRFIRLGSVVGKAFNFEMTLSGIIIKNFHEAVFKQKIRHANKRNKPLITIR